MDVHTCVEQSAQAGFEHQAVVYNGPDGLLAVVVPFIREGIDRGEPVLVALPPDKLDAVERALGADATRADFVDMSELGANPACIIPEWRRFLEDAGAEGPVRGVAEPVWSGRRHVEMEEAALHEALLNVAFVGGQAWQMMCLFDEATLPPEVIADAARCHPAVTGAAVGGGCVGAEQASSRFSRPLPPAPEDAAVVPFGARDLASLRRLVARLAACAGVERDSVDDLVLAAHELATNSVTHGGGAGVLRSWTLPDALVVEVSDTGVIEDPLVGRDLVQDLAENGRGIWMANQLCDLVQVRSGAGGTVVRLFCWL